MTTELDVLIGKTLVGWIRRAGNQEEISFAFSDSYLELAARPVLGQWFLDHLGETIRTRMRLHPFFSNLLPEGILRDEIARRAGVPPDRELFLLAELGEDLPGAVRIVAQSIDSDLEGEREIESDGDGPLKFSLAGIQLKLSVLQTGGRLSFPASGRGGNYIVKIPDDRYPDLPENEWSMLRWAQEVGIEAANAEIIGLDSIANLPRDFSRRSQRVLAVQRFDRLDGGRRVHIEDFAQVLAEYPTQRAKYKAANYETLGNVIRRVAGAAAYAEFVRRLVFIIASGNGDAHIKNWSLRYPDGIQAALAPAYDLVSTIQYMRNDDLGLRLAKNHAWDRIDIAAFERLARKTGESERTVTDLVRETVDRIRTAWKDLALELPLSLAFRARIAEHWRQVPLMNS